MNNESYYNATISLPISLYLFVTIVEYLTLSTIIIITRLMHINNAFGAIFILGIMVIIIESESDKDDDDDQRVHTHEQWGGGSINTR